MTKVLTLFGVLVAGWVVSGCGNRADNFALPPGDIERGQQTFVALGCNSCHYVADGVQRMKTGANPEIYVQLGGRSRR